MANCIIIAAGPYITPLHSRIQRNLGAYRIATALDNAGYSSFVIDFTQYFSIDEIIKVVSHHLSEETIWVGFASTFFQDLHGAKPSLFPYWSDQDLNKLFHYIRSNSNAKVIYGGVRSLWANDNRVDHYVLGYADNAVIDVTNSLRDKKQLNRIIDSKDYPEPAMDNIKTHWWRKDFNILQGESLPLEMARGCIFKCKFCGYSLIGKKKGTYLRDIEEVRDDLIRTWEATGSTNYYITDDTFNDDNDKIEAIHKLFTSLPFKIKFSCYLRLDLLNKYRHQADLLTEAGLVGNFFGIETLNKKSGVAIGKGLSPDKVKDTIYWLGEKWKNKVNMGCGLIFGLPYDTVEYFKEVEDWVLDPNNPMSSIEVYPLVLFKKKVGEYSSEFSMNPEIYGYEIDSNNNWTLKEQGLNSDICKQYTNDLMRRRFPMNKISEFQLMTFANMGIDIPSIQNLKYVDVTKYNFSEINALKLNQYKTMLGL